MLPSVNGGPAGWLGFAIINTTDLKMTGENSPATLLHSASDRGSACQWLLLNAASAPATYRAIKDSPEGHGKDYDKIVDWAPDALAWIREQAEAGGDSLSASRSNPVMYQHAIQPSVWSIIAPPPCALLVKHLSDIRRYGRCLLHRLALQRREEPRSEHP
jgi:hypothetical protein